LFLVTLGLREKDSTRGAIERRIVMARTPREKNKPCLGTFVMGNVPLAYIVEQEGGGDEFYNAARRILLPQRGSLPSFSLS